ncbi:MAG: hypothetical protein JJE52_09700 [Acidimicrobiia bacterium]|nr:hypothetical protein [Acidimicrobiia bacterium]
MSPVERRTSRSTTTAILVALAGVVAGLGLVLFVVNLASRGGEDVKINIGDDRFHAGSAEQRAQTIDEGGPILFADVAGGDRDILLQHLGDDPQSGWLAFAAAAPGKPRDCFLQWQAETGDFADCDGDRFPADGEGLTTYPVAIEDGDLVVDVNAEFRDDEEAPADPQ